MKRAIRSSGSKCLSLQTPRSSGEIRPSGMTAAASVKTTPAPPTARAARWAKCQSLAKPASEEYWHIGDTPMRLANVTSRSLNSLNRWDIRRLSRVIDGRPGLRRFREGTETLLCRTHMRPEELNFKSDFCPYGRDRAARASDRGAPRGDRAKPQAHAGRPGLGRHRTGGARLNDARRARFHAGPDDRRDRTRHWRSGALGQQQSQHRAVRAFTETGRGREERRDRRPRARRGRRDAEELVV